jgi:hypothetical protein
VKEIQNEPIRWINKTEKHWGISKQPVPNWIDFFRCFRLWLAAFLLFFTTIKPNFITCLNEITTFNVLPNRKLRFTNYFSTNDASKFCGPSLYHCALSIWVLMMDRNTIDDWP